MSVSYTMRYPEDLKRLIDSAAKSGGVSLPQLIVAACWKYLERTDGSIQTKAVRMRQSRIPDGGVGAVCDQFDCVSPRISLTEAVSMSSELPVACGPRSQDVRAVPSEALRAIAAGSIQAQLASIEAPLLQLCSHKEWAEDGEQYRCRLHAGHKGKCAPGERVS